MECVSCGAQTGSDAFLCSIACGIEGEIEMARNRTRLAALRQVRRGLPAEARGLLDRNSELAEALQQVYRVARA